MSPRKIGAWFLDPSTPLSASGIELAELETFLLVVETGSFSQAATRLHISQPSVTSRIKRLESKIGAKLIERTSRHLRLTVAGTGLSRESALSLRGLQGLVLAFLKNLVSGCERVVVASTPALAEARIAPLIARFGENHPDMQAHLIDLPHAQCMTAIERGVAHIGVLPLEAVNPKYRVERLWSEPMMMVVPYSHPLASLDVITMVELAANPLTVAEYYRPMLIRLAELLARNALAMAPSQSIAEMPTLFGLVNAHKCLTLLPLSSALRCLGTKAIPLDIAGFEMRREFGLVSRSGSDPNDACRIFCQMLRASALQDPTLDFRPAALVPHAAKASSQAPKGQAGLCGDRDYDA
jgi:DNA-binding transcriptional LysR family regulator